MRNRLTVILIALVGLVFSLVFARQLIRSRTLSREGWTETPVRVLTFGSLVSSRGALEPIFKKFEATHRVKLEVVVSADPGLLLERLKVGGAFDLVIGLDQSTLDRARAEFTWHPLAIDHAGWFDAAAGASDTSFVAFEWSPLTFVHRADDRPTPTKFADLADPRFAGQFTIPDPRGTTPGRQFARWATERAGGDAAAWFARFRPNVSAVTPTWTAAYAVFEQKKTRFVWTYLTSLAFHWGTEKDHAYQPLVFAEGHPVQTDLAAVPSACRECDLGEKLLRTLLEPEAQTLLMRRNFMFPVLRDVTSGTVFAELPTLEIAEPRASTGLGEWNAVFAR